MHIKKGETAPSFTLLNSDKKPVSLSDFSNKNVVILFYPLAFSGVCTAELCGVSNELHRYNDLNAEVLAISVDSIFVLDKYKQDAGINFTLLSDFNKDVSKSYGVLYDMFPAFEMRGVSKRAAFVVNRMGVVEYAEVCLSPGDQPDFEKILETLKHLSAIVQEA